jgi:hypothetical protein
VSQEGAPVESFAGVIEPLSIVHVAPELETVMSPLSPSATDAVGTPHDVAVPSVVRNLPLFPVCEGV